MNQALGSIDYSDQTGFFDPAKIVDTLTVIGTGGIGTGALPQLVKLGFRKFTLWEPDFVEPRNLASQQIFTAANLYRSKVEAVSDFLYAHGAEEVQVNQRLFTADDYLEGIVIPAVDSMAARKIVWEAVKRNYQQHGNISLVLDGRIGGYQASLYTVEPFDGAWYEDPNILFDDERASELPCGQRAIVHPAACLGYLMASQLINWHNGDPWYKQIHEHAQTLQRIKAGKVG